MTSHFNTEIVTATLDSLVTKSSNELHESYTHLKGLSESLQREQSRLLLLEEQTEAAVSRMAAIQTDIDATVSAIILRQNQIKSVFETLGSTPPDMPSPSHTNPPLYSTPHLTQTSVLEEVQQKLAESQSELCETQRVLQNYKTQVEVNKMKALHSALHSCLTATSFDDFVSKINRIPTNIRMEVHKELHFATKDAKYLDLRHWYFELKPSNLYSDYGECVSEHVNNLVDLCMDTPNESGFKQMFLQIPLSLRSEAHQILYHRCTFKAKTTILKWCSSISPFDLFGDDMDAWNLNDDPEITLHVEATTSISQELHLQQLFRKIPLSLRIDVFKVLLFEIAGDDSCKHVYQWAIRLSSDHLYCNYGECMSDEIKPHVAACLDKLSLKTIKTKLLAVPLEFRPAVHQIIFFRKIHPESDITLDPNDLYGY